MKGESMFALTPQGPIVQFLLVSTLVGMVNAACTSKSDIGTATNPNSKSGTASAYPLVTPPVKRATPAAFKSASTDKATEQDRGRRRMLDAALDANAFISRFFSAGPTELFNVLGSVDGLITNINMQAASNDQPCLNQNAVGYDLVVPGGNITMYAQCYQTQPPMFDGDPGLVQWGMVDGTFYVYSAVGVGWTAAIATPLTSAADANTSSINPNNYSIHAWYSVGLNNFTVTASGMDGTGWFNGSYCIAEIAADPNTQQFEMTAAGGGIGFCGAQFVSDSNTIFGVGSSDMGTTCTDAASVCISASDGTVAADCTVAASNFTLPPLGRQTTPISSSITWAASTYPGDSSDNVILNGTTTDSAHFGPTAPTPSVGHFVSQEASGG